MARDWQAMITRLTVERDVAAPADLKEINQRLKLARRMVRFCKTRAGYLA